MVSGGEVVRGGERWWGSGLRLWRLVYLLEPPVKEIVLALPEAALGKGLDVALDAAAHHHCVFDRKLTCNARKRCQVWSQVLDVKSNVKLM